MMASSLLLIVCFNHSINHDDDSYRVDRSHADLYGYPNYDDWAINQCIDTSDHPDMLLTQSKLLQTRSNIMTMININMKYITAYSEWTRSEILHLWITFLLLSSILNWGNKMATISVIREDMTIDHVAMMIIPSWLMASVAAGQLKGNMRKDLDIPRVIMTYWKFIFCCYSFYFPQFCIWKTYSNEPNIHEVGKWNLWWFIFLFFRCDGSWLSFEQPPAGP